MPLGFPASCSGPLGLANSLCLWGLSCAFVGCQCIPGLYILGTHSISVSPEISECPLGGKISRLGTRALPVTCSPDIPAPPLSSPWGLHSAVISLWRPLSTLIITAAHPKLRFPSCCIFPHSTHPHFLYIICLFSLDLKFQKAKDFCLLHSLLYPQHLQPNLAHSRHSVNASGRNKSVPGFVTDA